MRYSALKLTEIDTPMRSIDPFSTSYWESPKQKAMDPPRQPLNTMNPPNTAAPLNASVLKSFFTPASALSSQSSPLNQQSASLSASTAASNSATSSDTVDAKTQKPKKLMPEEDMAAFKAEIEGSDLSKVGLIEVLKKKFPGRSGAAIKASLELVAKRVGAKEVDKRWVVGAV